MRSARTIRFFSLLLAALALGVSPSSASEIPALTWERGKTLSVVLGGYAENLDWQIVLEGENGEVKSSKSVKSDAGFIVYSISLPRELPVGQYKVVARDSDGKKTVVSVVQVIERIQYNVLEIPGDFRFLTLLLLVVVAMQITTRTWVRIESDGLDRDIHNSGLDYIHTEKNLLLAALASQRIRWKRRWFGPDYLPRDFVSAGNVLKPILPPVALLVGLYCGITGLLIPVETKSSIALLMLLAIISVLDRYSAKLATVGFVSFYILFNATLNFPALLSLLALVLLLFLPQYVGDVTREFIAREFRRTIRTRLIYEGLAAFAAGASVFWLYLLGESFNFGGNTDASRISPVAIGVALTYFIRSLYSCSWTNINQESSRRASKVFPVLGFRSALSTFGIIVSACFVWSESLKIALVFGFFVGGSLISIHLVAKRTFFLGSSIFSRAFLQVGIVLTLELTLLLLIARLPEVVSDRAKLALLILGLPLFLLAILRLLTAVPNSYVGDSEAPQGSKRENLKGQE